ncbi:MAG TPA: four helix bundle protein [Candidatus Omnitrophica bacterium]|nr:four helix bundle protein [Candidatus Omnitrophota bacterium]
MQEKKKIVSFKDLIVYQDTYGSMLKVMKEVVPKLPDSEKFDLKDQLSRSCKAIPRLIAEGYAQRHQKMGFQKYLDDAMAECNEMVVSLSQCRDIYPAYSNLEICEELIKSYDKSGRQLYKLRESWSNFKRKTNNLT